MIAYDTEAPHTLTDAQYLHIANTMCAIQSRCALLVHAAMNGLDKPSAVRKESGGCGTCSVWYEDHLACTIEWVMGGAGEHVIEVFWEPTWAYLGTVAS